jgi:hypothetical protein
MVARSWRCATNAPTPKSPTSAETTMRHSAVEHVVEQLLVQQGNETSIYLKQSLGYEFMKEARTTQPIFPGEDNDAYYLLQGTTSE